MDSAPLTLPARRRREKVIRIFPNDDSAPRLIGALLAEQNERRLGRRYFDMDEFRQWAEVHTAVVPTHTVVTLQA